MIKPPRFAPLLTALLCACGQPPQATDSPPQVLTALRASADSTRPIAVELAHFREGMERPRGLRGERSRDALVRAFVRAVERRDTARLRELHLSAPEFAFFYYPYTIYTHPPYQQAPGLVWLLTSQNSQKGITRVLRRFGGQSLAYQGYRCARTEPQDINVLHGDCTLSLGGESAARSLFGTIIERGGRFKFVSYANRF